MIVVVYEMIRKIIEYLKADILTCQSREGVDLNQYKHDYQTEISVSIETRQHGYYIPENN